MGLPHPAGRDNPKFMRFDAIAAIKDLVLCLFFALAVWAPLGSWILRRIRRKSDDAGLSLSIAFGMGTWGIWILTLGTLGALYPAIVLASAVGLLVGLRAYLPLTRTGAPASLRPALLIVLFISIALGYFFIVFTSALAPETSFDALNVHLPYARDAALAHGIRFAPNNWSSAMPALPLMSYITAFILSGVTLARLCNGLCYILCGGVIIWFVSKWWGSLRGVAAALLFWSCPIAIYEATTSMIDLPVTLYGSIAAFSCLEWVRSRDRGYFWISSAAFGLALSCKYHAAFWLPPFLLLISIVSDPLKNQIFNKKRDLAPLDVKYPGTEERWHHKGRWVFAYVVLAGLIALPWFVRAWAYTGNPVFPLANSVFKSPWFTPAMEAAATAMYANEGVGRSVGALAKLPYTATFHPGPFRGTLGAIFLIGTALAGIRCAGRKFRQTEAGLLTCSGLLFIGCYFYAWALTAQEIRYLLPLAPLLGAISAVGLLGPETKSRFALMAGTAAVLGASIIAFPGVYGEVIREWTYWHSYQSPMAYLRGTQTAEAYLERDIPSIYVYEYIGRNLKARDRILLLNDAYQFYSRIPTLYSFTVEGEGILLEQSESGVMDKMKRAGITHVLLNYNGLAPLPGVVPRQGAYFFLEQAFQERYLKLVYSNHNVTLFAVTYGEHD
jgi:hypothetical protein